MAKHIKDRADFEIIRYANCWEDADILIDALDPQPGKRFLSIASAGDNSFSLIARGASVVAVDLSPAQLACVELRREAFRHLDYRELLAFLGGAPSHHRRATYQQLEKGLSPQASRFWNQRIPVIKKGFIHAGKFENYFKLFRTRIIPLIHPARRVQRLLEKKSLDDQATYYARHWNTFRWRMLFRIFFSRWMMGKRGRDPEFFRFVEGSVADRILTRTEYALTRIPTHSNPYLRYILTGNYGVASEQQGIEALPHYLRRENYEPIREGLHRLVLFHGSIQEAVEAMRETLFDGFNLSDIFEYLDDTTCEHLYRLLIDVARPGARWVYWNMLVPRTCPPGISHQVTHLSQLADELFQRDKAWFYSRLVIEEKKG